MAKKSITKKSKKTSKPVKRSALKSKPVSTQKKSPVKWHAAPLKGSFMVLSIIGFLVSAYWIYPLSFNYGLAFMLIFTAMFISSLISMTKAPLLD
ncbi:MAG: hypothetical protein KKA62_02105 [Nanoarchaeota archaeon]|nr:hypothetical protein [Nanoarchaeota archaeon]MBU1644102.1 hypothetical protein [Nanoarchaeota archaeon]MBU1976728.1 hypothetical protein [Nanoarchaeota archaeon]